MDNFTFVTQIRQQPDSREISGSHSGAAEDFEPSVT
jgi:hypothetical protein